MSGGERMCPDWVMLGVPRPDGSVMIFASVELRDAELRHEVDDLDLEALSRDRDWRVPWARRRFFLTVELKTYVMAHGATYAEALARLMREWSPEQAAAEVEPRRALPWRG